MTLEEIEKEMEVLADAITAEAATRHAQYLEIQSTLDSLGNVDDKFEFDVRNLEISINNEITARTSAVSREIQARTIGEAGLKELVKRLAETLDKLSDRHEHLANKYRELTSRFDTLVESLKS